MIEKIRRCFLSNRVRYTKHAIFEMEHEEFGEILDRELEVAILAGEELFQYPEDTPLRSCLIFGTPATEDRFMWFVPMMENRMKHW